MSPRFAGVLATLSGLFGLLVYWPQLQPLLEWGLDRFGTVVLHPQAQAFALAVVCGASVAWFVPHYLPAYFEARQTRKRMALYNSALTFAIAFYLQPTERGLLFAAIAGMVGWPFILGVARVVYGLLPRAEPPSLKSGAHSE